MKKVALKSVASVQGGYQAKRNVKDKSGGTHRLIQGRDFDSFHNLQEHSLKLFFPQRKPELYIVNKGDVLFQSRGTQNIAYCIEEDLKDTLAAGSFYIIRIKNENLIPHYLAWWLNQKSAQTYFRTQASGTIMSFVPITVLANYKIPIPPLATQKRIKEVFSLWKKEQMLINKINERRRELIDTVCFNTIIKQGE